MRVGKTASLVLPRNPGGNREPNQNEGGENSQSGVAKKLCSKVYQVAKYNILILKPLTVRSKVYQVWSWNYVWLLTKSWWCVSS
jgi:hypothetical protein